jgi:NADPH:quinone reductase-like Zn-dependent oxidoreductase
MKAARVHVWGGPEQIELLDIATPSPAPGQVLIEVHASTANRADSLLYEGALADYLSLEPPTTIGWDVAGVIVEVGDGVTHVRPGDAVYGQASVIAGGSGAMAEYAITSAEAIAKMPVGLSYPEAAAVCLVGLSAVEGVADALRLRSGERLLVHGGSGGVGAAAIQFAKNVGASVAATARGDGIARAKALGADMVIDFEDEQFEDAVSGFDAVFDTVGDDVYRRSLDVLKPGGRIVSMHARPDPAKTNEREISAHFVITKVTTEKLGRLSKLLTEGVVTPQVARIYPLEDVRAAFEARAAGRVPGKIVIAVRPNDDSPEVPR